MAKCVLLILENMESFHEDLSKIIKKDFWKFYNWISSSATKLQQILKLCCRHAFFALHLLSNIKNKMSIHRSITSTAFLFYFRKKIVHLKTLFYLDEIYKNESLYLLDEKRIDLEMWSNWSQSNRWNLCRLDLIILML